MNTKEEKIRAEIRDSIIRLFQLKNQEKAFIAGSSKILYAGAVFDDKESCAFVDSFLDGWFGTGEKTEGITVMELMVWTSIETTDTYGGMTT